jgi:class 3 adenylate cyclase
LAIGTFLSNANDATRLSREDEARILSLEIEKTALRQTIDKQKRELESEQATSATHAQKVKELSDTVAEYRQKEQLAFLLERVGTEAKSALLASPGLRSEFTSAESRKLFAMSVDIRRSTDLMLKARSPHAFARFITALCDRLMAIVRDHHGVVDKFTGDGILCFFPEFFSGEDAGYRALAVADACHRTFQAQYRAARSSFHSVLNDVGLGIGIDYGECHFVQVAGSLTIVGAPVVYACRLSGAPAGTTLLNQPAYEAISQRHGGYVLLKESTIDVKHEGTLVAYTAELSRADFALKPPPWAARAAEIETSTTHQT